MTVEEKKKPLVVGDVVNCEKFGNGTITYIDHVGLGDEKYAVYHVALKNDDVRHFVAGKIKVIM